MIVTRTALTLGKIFLGALAFFAGTLLGGMLAAFAGMPIPALPAGADAETLLWFQLLAGVVFSGTLALVSRGLAGGFLFRGFALALFGWIAYSLNTYLEAAIFTTYEAGSSYTMVMQLCAVMVSSAVIAWLFPSAKGGGSIGTTAGASVAQFSPAQWAVRLLAALLAFPVIYTVFGLLVLPFVLTYYEQQMAGLMLPGWGEILPTLFLRSLLFLLACLPVLSGWQGTRLNLFLTLGSALFILVGGIYMLQSYWFPLTMRIVHGLEIMADSFVYSGVLVILLRSRAADRAPGRRLRYAGRQHHKIQIS